MNPSSHSAHPAYSGHPGHSSNTPTQSGAQYAHPPSQQGHQSHPPPHLPAQMPSHYKEVPNQNFMEVRIKPKNIREISKEDALQKYKRNAYIMGRIFSYPMEEGQEDPEDNQANQPLPMIDESHVNTIEEEINKLKDRHNQKLEEYKQKNQTFLNIMNDLKGVESHQELNDVVEKIRKENLVSYEHPFFNEASPFYFQSDETTIREVPANLRAPSWNESENLHIYQV